MQGQKLDENLRLLTWCFILVGYAMFGATFNLVYTCRTTIIFVTLKDSSLKSNGLPLNNSLGYKNVLQNGVKALSKLVLKNPVCRQKTQNFVHF